MNDLADLCIFSQFRNETYCSDTKINEVKERQRLLPLPL